MAAGVDDILSLPEAELLKQCRVQFYKSGGPGGQKRNKTASGVRIVHVPTGIEAHSNDFRAQAENRVRALHRLRFRIAADLRTAVAVRGYEPPAWLRAYLRQGQIHVNVKNPDFARIAAHVLDLLVAREGRVADVAALVGVSSSSLVKFLKAQQEIWDRACGIRRSAGLRANPFPR